MCSQGSDSEAFNPSGSSGLLSDYNILEMCADGLVLQSILLSNNPVDHVKKRSAMIDVTKKCKWSLLNIVEPVEISAGFTSRCQEQSARVLLENSGYSAYQELIDIVDKNTILEVDRQDDNVHDRKVEESHTPYICQWKKYFTPVATCTLSWTDLLLNPLMIADLKKLENTKCQQEKDTLCKDILEKYGSHVSTSNTFGGIYGVKVESTKFSEDLRETTRQLLEEIVDEVDFSTDTSAFQEQLNYLNNGELAENSTLSLQIFGGPDHFLALEYWRNGLQSTSSTWKVIDRGPLEQYVPVWRIISLNHKNDFLHYEAVSDMIKACWENQTGVQDTSSDLERFIMCEDLVESLIENAEIWSRLSEDQFTEKCVEFVTEFTKVHYQIWMNQPEETDLYWRQNVICHNTIQEFLLRLVRCMDSKDLPSVLKVDLFEQIQTLVEKYILSNPTSFSNLNTILSVIKSYVITEEVKAVSTYDDEERLISRIKKQVLYITSTNELITEMLLYNVLVALIRLKQILAKTDEGHLQYLITAIFYENLKSGIPKKTDVSERKWKSMTDKILKLEHQIKELWGMSKEEGQASVFIIALEEVEDLNNSKKEAESVIQTLRDDMGSDLCASLEHLIEKDDGNPAKLKDELNLIRKQRVTQTEVMRSSLCEIGELVCHDVSKQPQHKGHSVHKNDILERLGLEEYCNEKLSMRHIKKISSQTIQSNKPSKLQEVPWCFIQKLMMVHSGALMLKCIEGQCGKKHKGQLEDEENIDEWLSDDTEDTLVLNPLDVIVAVFMCSDHFVQQELVQKMSMCQIAVPFLLPNYNGSFYNLQWALRTIRKKWHQTSEGSETSIIEKDIVTHPMLAVTFIRLGDLQRSKSAFLNSLLSGSQDHHSFFTHSEMEGGHVPRKISNGLVELSWYLPQKKENEGRLLEPMVVMNLRGDAKSLSTQVGFLAEVSSMIFVFVDDIGKEEENVIATLLKSKSIFFLLINIKNNKTEAVTRRLKHLKSICEITRDNVLVRGMKNDAEFVSTVLSSICKAERRYVTLEGMSAACRKLGFYIDEDYQPCKAGRKNAEKVLSDLNPDKIVELKEKIFPFQGLHWQEFSRIEKEYKRLKDTGEKTPLEYAKELEQKKKELRQKQLENELSPAIKMFIEALLGSTNDERLFFLHWMKFKLDSISSTILPELCEKLVTQIRRTNGKEQLLNRLSRSSLGLEHFLREIGQIYEASFYCSDPDLKKHLTKLPNAAADMLLSGFPVELIDGDVSNIPIRWVSDVLKQVQIKTHPDTRIFVLSVLGLQSTGKSTLLNTLFGLQFAVSAGRCTWGAFMQLICVDQHMKAELGCDYIMVIDTEGLRAEELLNITNNYEHDNELATLITGLSDIVLVNLSSESSSEMQDILQIIVHALIRMKEVGIKPSIYFIHHNVSDLSASALNFSGVTKFFKQLDILTQMAAKQENKEQTYTKFSDVIHYDIKKTMKYMPGLWHSQPPMASVSSGYSEKVFELKQQLVDHIKQQRKKRLPLTISDFITLMEDFSNAVKSEDFLFSFQNSLGAVAYSKLSSEYSDWKWEIQKSFTQWKEKAERRIKNCEEIDNLEPALKSEADELARKQELEGLRKLQAYFTSDVNNKELIENHKHHFEVNIKTLCMECKKNAVRKSEEFIKLHQSLIDFQKQINKYEEKIEEKVNELMQKCKQEKNKLTETQLKGEFENMWEEIVKSFKIPEDHVNIRADMENAIMADESKRKDIKEKLWESHLSQAKHFIVTDKHVNTKSSYPCYSCDLAKQITSDIKEKVHSWWPFSNKNTTEMVASNADKEIGSMRFEGGLQEKDIQRTASKGGYHVNKSWSSNAHVMKVQKIADSVISKCNKYLDDLINKTTDYDQNYCTGVIKEIDKQTENLGEGHKLVNSQFHVDIKLHICGTAVYRFQEMHNKFMREHNIVNKLQERKDTYWETFSEMYHERDLSKKVTNQFCNLCLKPSLIDEIQRQLSRDIVNQMRETWAPVVLRSIINFQLSLLVSLYDGEDFEAYKAYITDYDWFAEEWLAAQAEEFCRSELNGKTQFTLLLEGIISNLFEELMKILDRKELNTGKELLHMLMKEMEKIMVLKKENLGNIMFKNMGDASHLIENLREAIQVLQKEVIEEANKWDPSSKVRRLPNPPHKEMMSFLKGCGKKCPFCGTPCELEGNDHQHYSRNHRVLTIEKKAKHHHLSSRTRLQKFNFVFWRKAHQKTVNCIFHKVPMKGYEVHSLLNDNWGQLYKDYTSIYWQFVYKKYYKEFAQWHKHEPVRIRVNITKHDVKTHLEKVYQVHLDGLKIHESKTTISRVISKWKEMKVTTKNEKL